MPPQGIMNPESASGWSGLGIAPRNLSTRKKGQETFNSYLGLDIKERRILWRYAEHTNSHETTAYLSERLLAHERMGHTTLVLIWDQAPWHVSKYVRNWIREHNGLVRREGRGTRLITVCQPKRAFWLNYVEPIIMHSKSKVLPCRQFETPEQQKAALDRYWLHHNLANATIPQVEGICGVLH